MESRAVVVEDALEMKPGELRTIAIGDDEEVLLARLSTGFVATQPKCTHYGAPLVEGTVHDDTLICPWHHACFALRTGALVEPPGLEGLETYPVTQDERGVVIHLGAPTADEAPSEAADDSRVFAIVGAGAAGMHAALALREEGFAGRVILISKEAHLPYDRPNNSKDYLQGALPEPEMYFRDREDYEAQNIELMLGQSVTDIDAAQKVITLAGGETVRADGIIVATGGAPRSLSIPGAELAGVLTLRSIDDSEEIREAAKDAEHAVIIGAGFIGLEAAMSLRELGVASVTVVAPDETPLAGVLGETLGARVQRIHEDHGVSFRLGERAAEICGEERAEQVRLEGGESLRADLVIVGIGIEPRADFLRGVERGDDGAVLVDETLQAAPGVYAVGDIARFPDWRTDARIRVEHWRVAAQHGRLAAANLLATPKPYRGVPFFWSAHYDTVFCYLGHAEGWDDVHVDGDLDGEFIAYYLSDGAIAAAAAVGRSEDFTALHHLMREGALPPLRTLCDEGPAAVLSASTPPAR